MRNKGKIITAVVILLLFSSFAYAQDFADAFAPLFDLFSYIFFDLGTQIVFRKFLLWMLLFALLTTLVRKLPFLKDEKESRRGNVIALVLSLIMVIGIPDNVITLIYDQYAFITALLLYLLVPILLFIATKDVESPLIKGLLFLGLGILLMILSNSFLSSNTSMRQFIVWMNVAAGILMILGAGMILFGGGKSVAGAVSSISSGRWNPFKGGKRKLEAGNAPPPGPRTGRTPVGHLAHALDAEIDTLRADVEKVHNIFHLKMVPSANADAKNNHDAFENATIARDTSHQSQYMADLTNMNLTIDNCINTARTIRGSPVISSWTVAQRADCSNAIISLTRIINDISKFHKKYADMLSKYQEPR
ncbi:MAG: hypothetical protein AABW92_04380 [Nanoarchaeota archaeon]